jgi:DNA processing protein
MSQHLTPTTLSDAERIAWLRLIRTEAVGPITFRRLLERFGSAAAALAAVPELARRGGRAPVRIATADEAEAEMEALAKAGGRMLALPESSYPPALRAIEDAPPLLAVIGDAGLLQRTAIGIVGGRNASAGGLRIAEQMARALGEAGLLLVSGLARGIDTAAHRGALGSGTVAVLAGGADVVYPPENVSLYRQIAAAGAIVSEMPVAMAPQARHFPRRNRLISGLSSGVVVIEARLKSGSLITARLALEQGREVFAVPGSPLDPRAHGGNDLIRQGAILTEGAEDVLRGIASAGTVAPAAEVFVPRETEPPPEEPPPDADEARRTLQTMLSPTPIPVDDLVRICHLPPAVVHTILLDWELAGRLERHPGNRVALMSPPTGAEHE